MEFRPTVTVVVCTHKRPEHLKNCLASLARQTYAHFDVLVVESGPAQSSREISHANGAAYVHEPIAGISRARNAGVRASRSEIVAFIDDDAMAEPSWLETLVPVFHDPSIGAATGGTRYMKSYGRDRYMSADVAQEPFRPCRVFDRNESDWFASACFGGIGDGMNMAFRRSLFAHLVRFDDRLGRGCVLDGGDEHVAYLSVLAEGYRIVHVPAAIVLHPATTDTRALAAERAGLLRSSIAYMFFLWFELPAHRPELVRFVWRAVRKRLARRCAGTVASTHISRWQTLQAIVSGPTVYLKARRTWKVQGTIAAGLPKEGAIHSGYHRAAARPTAHSHFS